MSPTTGGIEADLGPPQRGQRTFQVHVGGSLIDARTRTRTGFLGAGFVDLINVLGRVSEDHDTVPAHFNEAAGDDQRSLGASKPVAQFARLEHRQQRSVVRQDAELAFRPWCGERVDIALVE